MFWVCIIGLILTDLSSAIDRLLFWSQGFDPFEGFEASKDLFLHPAANSLFAQYIQTSDMTTSKLQKLTLAGCDELLTRMGPFFKTSEPDPILTRPNSYTMVNVLFVRSRKENLNSLLIHF